MKKKIYEEHTYSDYSVRRQGPSMLVPGKMIRLTPRFCCPRCGQDHPDIEHGEELHCTCGLHFARSGNLLRVSGQPLPDPTSNIH